MQRNTRDYVEMCTGRGDGSKSMGMGTVVMVIPWEWGSHDGSTAGRGMIVLSYFRGDNSSARMDF